MARSRPQVSLATYSIEVALKGKQKREILSKIAGLDLLNLLQQFFKDSKSPLKDPSNQTVLHVKSLVFQKTRLTSWEARIQKIFTRNTPLLLNATSLCLRSRMGFEIYLLPKHRLICCLL